MAPLHWQTSLVAVFAAFSHAIPYEEYILAPSSRDLHPVSVYKINGTVNGADTLTGDALGSATFTDDSAVTYDYGKNIGGVVSLTIGEVSDENQYIGVTFSESSLWISGKSSDATADSGVDEILWFQPKKAGTYSARREQDRGAFKYLSLVKNTTGTLEVTQVTTHFTAMPHYADDQMRNYTGYFHCDDELINRVWYAGAYTNQLCTIDPKHGDALIFLDVIFGNMSGDDVGTLPWYNNYTITNGTSALIDGAKRDRLVWAGDYAIAVPGLVVSTNDLVSVQNALISLFDFQNKETGQLPYAGTPFRPTLSLTYHMYTLIGISNYYLYSVSIHLGDDLDFLKSIWDDVKLAANFALSYVDETGLMNATAAPDDWLRFGMGATNSPQATTLRCVTCDKKQHEIFCASPSKEHEIHLKVSKPLTSHQANSILYYTLYQLNILAEALGENDIVDNYTKTAETIKTNINARLWDSSAGLYRDNDTTQLYPQDGNSWAVVANLTLNSTQNQDISEALSKRWGPYGAPAPEAGDAVQPLMESPKSPFISGFELQTHINAGNATRALELVRLMWGFMLDDPRMTNSTFIEGYAFNGEIKYAPYNNDPRISHAHGWATGPTSTLTFLIAGIQLKATGGSKWLIKPSLGDLKTAEAGFKTSLGDFSVSNKKEESGAFEVVFETPEGTEGSLSVEYPDAGGTLTVQSDTTGELKTIEVTVDEENDRVEVGGLSGGKWTAHFTPANCDS
ncbi:bacterial alpha-L-rhamnosidase domain-containing protein [Phyllosticta citribraziliensis]|uniref:Bacterial alpha-L-rhamnosidase domain-containing protein n=1 Tax=Phyllosticta citribraziliensis TaxID=989973 RepID=A0ABR1LM00_9PEZI